MERMPSVMPLSCLLQSDHREGKRSFRFRSPVLVTGRRSAVLRCTGSIVPAGTVVQYCMKQRKYTDSGANDDERKSRIVLESTVSVHDTMKGNPSASAGY